LSQKGFTQNSQLKTQNAGYASCKENKILVTTGITGYGHHFVDGGQHSTGKFG